MNSGEKADGTMFSTIEVRGGGLERYSEVARAIDVGTDEGLKFDEVEKQTMGTGNDTTRPRNAVFVIHREESRGSREIRVLPQYLHMEE
jgi:hypothetical protein